MARYADVNTIVFADKDGNQYQVKDIREIPEEQIAFEIDVTENNLLDEIASRKEVYGDFGEMQSYRIFDANIIELTEQNFDLSNIRKLKVPV